MSVVYSCPDCGADLEDDGGLWCPECERPVPAGEIRLAKCWFCLRLMPKSKIKEHGAWCEQFGLTPEAEREAAARDALAVELFGS